MTFKELLQQVITKVVGDKRSVENIKQNIYCRLTFADWESYAILFELPPIIIKFLQDLQKRDDMIAEIIEGKEGTLAIKCKMLDDYQKYYQEFVAFLKNSPGEPTAEAALLPAGPPGDSITAPEIPYVSLVFKSTLLGRGSASYVFLAEYTDLDGTKKPVALKVFIPTVYDESKFQQEVSTGFSLSRSACPHYFVKTLGSTTVTDYIAEGGAREERRAIVMERMDGNLGQYIFAPNRELGFSDALKIAQQITDGIAYLHRQTLVHRDIKTENIFLNIDPHNKNITDVKIGDFENITSLNVGRFAPGGVGTVLFMAPEIYSPTLVYRPASDVYSLAMVFYELFYANQTWRGMSDGHIQSLVLEGKRPEITAEDEDKIPECVRAELKSLLQLGWKQDPIDRPTIQVIQRGLAAIQRSYERSLAPASSHSPKAGSSFFTPSFATSHSTGSGLEL